MYRYVRSLQASPVAYWNFDEGIGTVANDSSGNNYTGTVVGATWTAGKYGSALSFNGTNSYVDAGTILNFTGPFTITMWLQKGAVSGTWRALISKGESTDDIYHNYYILLDTIDRLYFSIGSGTNFRNFTTSSTLDDTNLHHLAFVFGSSTDMRVYIDGVSQTGTYSGTATVPVANTSRTLIGASTPTLETLTGVIDEVKLFNYAMTTAEVQSDYTSTPTQCTSPIIVVNVT